LREAATERNRAAKLKEQISGAKRDLDEAISRAEAAQKARAETPILREAFEAVGAARATVGSLKSQVAVYEENASAIEERAADLRKRIDELRAQLQNYSDALENDLIAGREQIANRVKEAVGYEKQFVEASALLVNHFRDRPECRDLLREIYENRGGGQTWASGASAPAAKG
jgi:serine/threonine-protein kinase